MLPNRQEEIAKLRGCQVATIARLAHEGSLADTKPKLQPSFLRLSAMISCTRLGGSPTKRLSRFRLDMPSLR
jgi:hypothetical protein